MQPFPRKEEKEKDYTKRQMSIRIRATIGGDFKKEYFEKATYRSPSKHKA